MTVNFLPIYHATFFGGFVLPMIAFFFPIIVVTLTKQSNNSYFRYSAVLAGLVLMACLHFLTNNSTHPLLQKVVGQKAKCIVSDALPIGTIKSVVKFYNVDKYEYDFENNVLTIWKYNEKE